MSGLKIKFRTSAWEWAQAALLAANLGWTTVCLGGARPETMVVTSALTAALLVGYAGSLLRPPAEGGAVPFHQAGWYFLPFLVYAAGNVLLVTPVRWLGWIDWFGWVQAVAVFWIVLNGIRSPGPRRLLWGALVALAILTVAAGAYQRFVDHDWLMLHRTQVEQYVGRASGVFGIPNSMAALLLLVLPMTGVLTFRPGATAVARVFFGWITLVLLFGVGITVSRGAWLGFALALTVWPLLRAGMSWRRRLRLAAGVLALVVVAISAATLASPVVRTRLTQLAQDMGERSRPILWRAAWQMAREHPLVGTGAGSFDVEFERFRPEGFLPQPVWAHNDYLNTLSDYGAVGFALSAGAVLLVILAQVRRSGGPGRTAGTLAAGPRFTGRPDLRGDPLVTQAQAVGLLAFALQLFVDFHLKIPALALACAVMAAIAVASTPHFGCSARAEGVATGRSRWSAVLVAATSIGLAVVIVILIVPAYRAEALRLTARERIDRLVAESAKTARYRATIDSARRDLTRAVELDPQNGRAWADLAYATAQWSRIEPADEAALGRAAEADANRAIELCSTNAEFWIRRGVAKDMQGAWLAAGDDFAHAITLAPKTALPWFHYAYHLSLRATGMDLAPVMVATCLRLDPNNAEALRLRHQLATGPRP